MSFLTLLKQALFLRFIERSSYLIPGFFLLLCAFIFPFALNVSSNTLPSLAAGIIWICALLGSLAGIQTLFRDEYIDGTLEFSVASGVSILYWSLSRIISFWIFSTFTLLIAAWLVCIFYNVPNQDILFSIIPVGLGLLGLAFLGGMASAVTVSSGPTNALISLLALPLAIPLLIFGAQASIKAIQGQSNINEIEFLLIAISVYIPLCTFLSALSLKSALEEK